MLAGVPVAVLIICQMRELLETASCKMTATGIAKPGEDADSQSASPLHWHAGMAKGN